MTTALCMLAAVALDGFFGEPTRAHPLIAFGHLAVWIEKRLYADRRFAGVLAWCCAVLIPLAMFWLLRYAVAQLTSWFLICADIFVLYLTIGLRSLAEHAIPVADALERADLDAARAAVGRMVSRDSGLLDPAQVAAAATESVLENGNDAVFGALFWFAVLGAPGAVLYRLANTLDAMWGYRTPRYERFGWAAARIDDALNGLPARLTAMSYSLLGNTRMALACWRTQAPAWDSPNAGPVMAAGAGALGVRLGGAAPYHGIWEERPPLGIGATPDANTIRRAVRLVRWSVALWLTIALVAAWLIAGVGDA